MNPFTAAAHWFHRKRRVRELRSDYQSNLCESTSSVDERVQFHLQHIEEYWDRCLGFLAKIPPESVIVSDLFACVSIGTEAAADDIRDYCSQHAAPPLFDAWHQYESQIATIRPGVADPRATLNAGALTFRSVLGLYVATIKVA